jgi:hypothetical protein
VVGRLVHVEEESDDLPPLGVVRAGGGHLKFDVIGDVYVEERVRGGWVKDRVCHGREVG